MLMICCANFFGVHLRSAERAAVVGNSGEDVRGIAPAPLCTANKPAAHHTARGAGKFGDGDRSGERTTKPLRLFGWRRADVDEQGDGCAGFEAADDFDEGKRVFADDEGFDVPAGA